MDESCKSLNRDGKFERIDIYTIECKGPRWQRRIDSKYVEELADSFKEVGQIHPIIVREGKLCYELLAGMHRYKAAMKNKDTHIYAIIVEANDADATLISIDENLRRSRPLTPEIAKALAEHKKQWKKKHRRGRKYKGKGERNHKIDYVEETASRLGVSKNLLKRAIYRAEKASDPTYDAWIEGEISDSQVDELVVFPSDKQNKLLPKIKGKSRAYTRAAAARMKGKKKDKSAVATSLSSELKSFEDTLMSLIVASDDGEEVVDKKLIKIHKLLGKLIDKN